MKKLYKNTILQFILALCVISFAACQEYGIDSQPEGPLKIQIDAMDSYEVFATSPDNISFNISSNTPWTITSDKQWCKVTPAMSASSSLVSEISVSCESNTDFQPRTAKLTIKAEGIEEDKVITIVQVSKEQLQVVPYGGTVKTEGETITFTIASNKPWRIIPSIQFLENIDKTSGQGTPNAEKETISITIPENTEAKRKGTITVKTEFEEKTFEITQSGIEVELEPATPGAVTFTGGVEEKTIAINANIDWKVEVPEEYSSWITAEKVSNEELKISTKLNGTFIVRSGKIKLDAVKALAGFEGTEVEIKQTDLQYSFTNSAQCTINPDGSVKVNGITGNNIDAKYTFKKGHLTFNFSELHLMGAGKTSNLLLNIYAVTGDHNANFNLTREATTAAPGTPLFKVGGTGVPWVAPMQKTFASAADLNAMRKVEIFYENDPTNIGKMRFRLRINDSDEFDGKPLTIYPNQPVTEFKAHIQFMNATSGDYYVIKSIDFDPLD